MQNNLTFVAVKWGVKYAPDYVNILFDMIRRNVPPDFPFSFICFTDDKTGLSPQIETQPLPAGLTGWWNKLYLFKAGLFPEGQRLFFLDLDTAITRDFSEIAAYQGDFAILRDFYRPAEWNSSLMLWRAGFGGEIWQSYEDASRPDISGGDQVWIQRCNLSADILQDLFPGSIVSFKDKAQLTLPADVKIVCFHGEPRPHQVRNGWVENVWKIGGATPPATASTISTAQQMENIRHTMNLSLPSLDTSMPTDRNRHICIVGGGASAVTLVDELKHRKQDGCTIWALNGAYQRLADQGIQPDVQIMCGPGANRASNVPHENAKLLYASQCHPEVFAKAAQVSQCVVVWHALIDGIRDILGRQNALLINGSTTGMRSISLAQTLGFGSIHLYGFDSSLPAAIAVNENHSDENQLINVNVDGKLFVSTPRLAQQVNNFRVIYQGLKMQGITLSMHGDGLLPYVAQKLAQLGSR